jgi:hypothetical protein
MAKIYDSNEEPAVTDTRIYPTTGIAESGRKGGMAAGISGGYGGFAPPIARPVRPVVEPVAPAVVEAAPVAAAVPVYEIRTGRAVAAGLLGTLLMTAVQYVLPLTMGHPMLDMPRLIGTPVVPGSSGIAYLTGWGIHLVMGVFLALLYAGLMHSARRQSHAHNGFWYAVTVWAISMFVLPVLIAMSPAAQSGQLSNPGFFLLGLGGFWAPLASLLGHALYGIFLGGMYKHRVRETLLP